MSGSMRLRLILPAGVLIDEEVIKVVAEAANGSFGMLPRHIDFVTALVPGLLSFLPVIGSEQFLAVDEGVLVKQGAGVTVATRNAVRGPDLGELRQRVEEQFETLDEHEKKARSALAKLEADFVRQFLKVEERV
jgi:F-type H+-transporting ATPase subunit epsilon